MEKLRLFIEPVMLLDRSAKDVYLKKNAIR